MSSISDRINKMYVEDINMLRAQVLELSNLLESKNNECNELKDENQILENRCEAFYNRIGELRMNVQVELSPPEYAQK